MVTKIVDVLAKLLECLREDNSLEEASLILSKKRGVDAPTLSAALSLIYDKVIMRKMLQTDKEQYRAKHFRLLTEEERERIGLENYNYMLHMTSLGLLDENDFELVLEELMLLDGAIKREDIDGLIFLTLEFLNADIPSGSRFLLYSSDTIN